MAWFAKVAAEPRKGTLILLDERPHSANLSQSFHQLLTFVRAHVVTFEYLL